VKIFLKMFCISSLACNVSLLATDSQIKYQIMTGEKSLSEYSCYSGLPEYNDCVDYWKDEIPVLPMQMVNPCGLMYDPSKRPLLPTEKIIKYFSGLKLDLYNFIGINNIFYKKNMISNDGIGFTLYGLCGSNPKMLLYKRKNDDVIFKYDKYNAYGILSCLNKTEKEYHFKDDYVIIDMSGR
jgi:hypothetical protein